MKNIDITKPVKLINPQIGEESVIYKVVNYNDVNNRCYIQPINISVVCQELVSINEIKNI